MKQPNKSMKYLICMTCGLCLAISVLTALLVVSVTGRVRSDVRSLNADKGAMPLDNSDSSVTELPVNKPSEIDSGNYAKLQKAYQVCRKIVDTKENSKQEDKINTSDDTQSTTSTTAALEDDNTTVTTTVPSQTSPTTTANREPDEDDTESVSNGKQPFNYNDVSSIADDISTLGDFVDKLSPDQISWDASDYNESGCVKITLDSEHGSAVLFVKPMADIPVAEGEAGSLSGDEINGWQWLQENRTAGCNISSVVWLDRKFGIAPVRDTGIGATLAQLTDMYLCVNGGATTLYKASDVITDQNKLNAILAAENVYTFVGGRVYSIGSYLDKYYNGKEHTFRFEDCDYIVQYGCNSIVEHNYTTGSWIIEYAVKEDSVVGISFMNKSYYKTEQKTAISTNIPSAGSEPDAVTTTRPENSEDVSEVISEVISEDVSQDVSEEMQEEYEEELLTDEDTVDDSEVSKEC